VRAQSNQPTSESSEPSEAGTPVEPVEPSAPAADQPHLRRPTGERFAAKDPPTLAVESSAHPTVKMRRHRRRFSEQVRVQHAHARARIIVITVVLCVAILAVSLYLARRSTDLMSRGANPLQTGSSGPAIALAISPIAPR
jgi:hypothetical protein